MRRVALKVAYDGTRFHGSQRQPNVRTVEGELLRALADMGAVTDPTEARFGCAGRTDAGVSAIGNVFAFDTAFRVDALPGALNARIRDAWVWAAVEVPSEFRARRAEGRAYRYFLPAAGVDGVALEEALQLFEGEHNFRVFCRLETGVTPVRRIDRIRVEGALPFFHAITFEAPSFLWNQIRRIVEAARRVAVGEVDAKAVADALATGTGPDFGLAAPEPLVLLDVRYGFPMPVDARAARRVTERLRARMMRRTTASAIDRAFLETLGVMP